MTGKDGSQRKKINVPERSELLAEFIGIFLGDGSFGTKYQISISYNYKCEAEYAKRIQRMVRMLFGIDSRQRIREKFGSGEIIINSSNLVDYLRRLLKVKEGKNKNTFELPAWIMKSRKYRTGLLRGLNDSEGCVYQHKYRSNSKIYSYTKLAFTKYCDRILVIFQNILDSIGIHSVKDNKRVHIYRTADVIKYFQLVGSNNPKNIERFNRFKEIDLSGEVPKLA